MLPYWLLFLFFAVGALLTLRPLSLALAAEVGATQASARRARPLFVLGMLLLTLMVGLRFEVGGDWFSYANIFERTTDDLGRELTRGDPAYQFLNWLVHELRGEMWHINIVCAVIFAIGLHRLATTQPEPWLVLVVAVPYLVTVVAMGYTRQAAALGVLMAGLAAVIRGAGLVKFAVYVFIAALFHRTAVVVLPLMAFVFPRSRLTDVLIVAGISLSLYFLLLQESVDTFTRNYLEARYSSQGAAIRIAQLALAAGLFFLSRQALGFSERERRIWRNFCVVTFGTVVALLISPSSTAVDRMSLYLMPMQVVVLARLTQWLTQPVLARLLVTLYSALVLFVWLNYASHAPAWLPYQTILEESGW